MLKYDKNNYKQKIQLTLVVFALILLAVLLIINLGSINIFVSKILAIVSPIIIGFAIAYLLNPILRFFEFVVFKKVKKKGFVRVISLILTYVVAVLFISAIVAIIFPRLVYSVIDLSKNFNSYLNTATDFVNTAIAKFSSNSEYYDSKQVADLVSNIFNESGDLFHNVGEYVISYALGLVTTLKNIFLGLFISIYVLISKEKLSAQAAKGARAYLSDNVYKVALRYLRKTNSTFGKFFIGKLFDSIIIAFITVVLLLICRMPYCLLIAMIVGILNLIPFFGFVVAIIVSAFIVLIATPEKLLLFLILMLIVYQIDINVIAPRILGRSAGISSLGVIVAVIIFGAYFGIIGMIVAVPISSVIILIVKEFIEKKLKQKGLPTETTSYYSDPDYKHESEEPRTAVMAIVDTAMHWAEAAIKHTSETENEKTEDPKSKHPSEDSENDEKDVQNDTSEMSGAEKK